MPMSRLPARPVPPASWLCQSRATPHLYIDGFFPIHLIRDKLHETPAVPCLLGPSARPGRVGGGAGPSPSHPQAYVPGLFPCRQDHPTDVEARAWMGLWVLKLLATFPSRQSPPHPYPSLIYEFIGLVCVTHTPLLLSFKYSALPLVEAKFRAFSYHIYNLHFQWGNHL